MRERLRLQGLRELRLVVPDARSSAIRHRVADQVALLNAGTEAEAMEWIKGVSEFDAAR